MAFDSFYDARDIPQGTMLSADVCIVGAGAAGITLARELISAGFRVCLLEAGGLNVDPEVDALSRIENVGRPYRANRMRLRYFGGTTNHWGGHCVPLSPSDMRLRSWVSEVGWPYSFDELRPYYVAAHRLLGLGDFNYNADAVATRSGAELIEFSGERVTSTVSRYNPVRFGLAFGPELDASTSLQCVLYADVSSIELEDPASETVESVRVQSVARNEFRVKASYFIVACGGIENARLLLSSRHQRPAGLGNHSELVGRYFMEHIWYESGYIVPADPINDFWAYLDEHLLGSGRKRFHIALPPAEQRRLEISAFRAELMARSAAFWELWKSRNRGLRVADVTAVAARPFELGHVLRCRQQATPDALVLGNYIEQVPNRDSRVTLSENLDPLGRPQARLDWRLSPQDHEAVVKAQEVIANELGGSGTGRMRIGIRDRYEVELEGANGGAHHMGTTRMHDDPALGVTDGQGRVHYTRNLYIAGSSLFPTCGYANPTLTIVATSLRMASHIGDRLARDGQPSTVSST
jgi:choline dehydrogenase-like flavoprotein